MDTSPLGRLTAQMMEQLEAAYGDSHSLRTVAIIAECDSPTDGKIIVGCSDDRPWVWEAFLHEALGTVERRRDALHDSNPDD